MEPDSDIPTVRADSAQDHVGALRIKAANREVWCQALKEVTRAKSSCDGIIGTSDVLEFRAMVNSARRALDRAELFFNTIEL